MLYHFEDEYLKIEADRSILSDNEKKTKHAVSSYRYVPMHSG